LNPPGRTEEMNQKISSSIKLKIAIESLKSKLDLDELALKYKVSVAQVFQWKRQLLEQGDQAFQEPPES
jgi:transposase-like protein